jgi:hypothetical protein
VSLYLLLKIYKKIGGYARATAGVSRCAALCVGMGGSAAWKNVMTATPSQVNRALIEPE